MNILAVDAGNTRIKWGLHADEGWLAQGWTTTAEPQLDPQWIDLPVPDKIIASNVAGDNAAQAIASACGKWQAEPDFLRASQNQCGVYNGYAVPQQLGSDRWAALIAARHIHPEKEVLVAQLGTAVTIDKLAADGRFYGGLILPGLNLMLDALAHNAAGLARHHGRATPHADNTADAMFSGAAFAIVGALECSYRQFENQPICLLSGGDMDILLPLLSIPVQPIRNLALEGLLRIALDTLERKK